MVGGYSLPEVTKAFRQKCRSQYPLCSLSEQALQAVWILLYNKKVYKYSMRLHIVNLNPDSRFKIGVFRQAEA